MEKRVLKLICDYSIRKKIVDQKLIKTLIASEISSNDLEPYFHNLQFVNEICHGNESAFGAYNPINKNILINYKLIKKRVEKSNFFYDDFENFMYMNLHICQIILHELQHVLQSKKVDEFGDHSFETKLLVATDPYIILLKYANDLYLGKITKNEFYILISQNRKLTDKNWILNPRERLAEFYSFVSIIQSIEFIKDLVPKLFNYFWNSLFTQMIIGYERISEDESCPTEAFFFRTNQIQVWKGFGFWNENFEKLLKNVNTQFTITERIKYGLPVSDSELEKVQILVKK